MTLSNEQLKTRIDQRNRQIETAMSRMLEPSKATVPARLFEAMSYSLFAGGKRLRPVLVLEWAEVVSKGRSVDSNCVLAAAVAIELIHTFSLVHDDLPAMDDDDLRRGKPTNHKVFGEALAILAGDAMTALAFELIASHSPPSIASKLVIELAKATGASGMIGGQVIDIESESIQLSLDQLRQLHAMKTGALITSACRMGAIAAGVDDTQLEATSLFGKHLGLAFQIIDDVLDATSDSATLGKTAGKDALQGKNTYPALLGLEASRELAFAEIARAISALEPYGTAADTLRAIAHFVVARER